MTKRSESTAIDNVRHRIFQLRGNRVILDSDLAQIYGVETKRLNEQVRRNADRFPGDFVFRCSREEVKVLKSQAAASESQHPDDQHDAGNWSQFATSSGKYRGAAYRPWAFTEHGAIMAANVLNSRKAVEMSVFVVRAFIKMREQFSATRDLARRLAEVEKSLVVHDGALRDLYAKIRPLLLPPDYPPKKRIGFGVKERRARYSARLRNLNRDSKL